MGKKGKTSVGRAVLKDRSKGGNLGKGKESWLHTSELNDCEDGSRLNTKSVTEQSALDEFLTTAELAGTEFVAEKLNISICNVDHSGGLPSKKEEQRIQEVQDQHKQFLQIPRRPKWDESTIPEQLDQLEKDNFLAWRRGLAELQEKDDLILTPFERNLEFWRQLWRVIERSDVVVQIVDARNPLLFHCEDLESYVKEVNYHKVNVVLINKADFLTQKQRESWAAYFKSIHVKAVFWSAVFETERLKQMKELEETESPPSQPEVVQPEVVMEQPEAVLTDNHVTQFLNLKEEPENIETNNPQEPSSDDTMEHRLSESDTNENISLERNIMKLDTTESDPRGSDIGEISPWRSDPSRSALTKSGPEALCSTTKYDKTRTSQNNQTSQITSSSSPSDVPKIGQLNLLLNNCISEGVEENRSLNADSGAGVSGETDDSMTDAKSLIEMDTLLSDCSMIVDKPSNLEKDVNTNDVRIAGKNVEFYTSGHLLTGEELLAYCQWLHLQYGGHVEAVKEEGEQQTVIGLVGYPNVGKSSTINAILQAKKVPVSATPGRTKHFQTLLVDKTICLCDCPGLVFPSFVSTKAEMVVSGILPIDQLRDHVPPVTLVCRRIPRDVLQTVYGINLHKPEEWEDPDRPPYAEELLDAYSQSRGFITSQARSDSPRSARYILKDYVNGKLLYCNPPPTLDPKDFQMSFTTDVKTVKKRPPTNSKSGNKTSVNKMDSEFFKEEDVKFHTSATTGTEQYRRLMTSQSDPNMVIVGKPWKKHGNKNKKEKLRRLKPNGY